MADISILLRFVNGLPRNVDLSSNALVVGSLKIGASELTSTILANLINLQNGSDFSNGTNAHTHDGRYYTETELGSTANGNSGSSKIGVDNSGFTNLTGSDVQTVLESVDSQLDATADEKVGVSSNDTTPGYLEDKIVVDNGSNSSNPLEASTLNDGGDEDFRIRFDQSKVDHGSIAGLGDDDHTQYILVAGTRAFTGDQSMGGNKITNSADPVSGQDLVTLSYMNARLNGLKPKQSVRVASLVNVDIATELENGDTLDGEVLATGDRVLLNGQTDPEDNGIYVVPASGAASRASDFDSLSPIDEINGSWVAVQEGSHSGKVFVQYGTVATLGTDPINFEYFNPIAGLIGGDMITFSGSTFSVDLATVSGLESTNPGNVAGQLRAKVDNASIEINGSNELQVKDAGVTLAKLASNSVDENKITTSVAGNGLSGGGGSALSVNVDDSSIEINSDSLRVKAAGVTNAMLAGSIDDSKLNQITTANKVAGSAVQLSGDGSIANDTGLEVRSSPSIKIDGEVAGESFAANTTFAVRYALNGETAGRLYKADKDASVSDKMHVVGFIQSGSALSAGNAAVLLDDGIITLGGSDTPFNAADIGKPVFLDSAGAFTVTPPSGTNIASAIIGIVRSTSSFKVEKRLPIVG